MRFFFWIVLFAFMMFGCNSNQDEKMSNRDKCFIYPSIVDSLQLRDLYDSARWFVYTWHCDENYLPKNDTSKSVTFGELSLSFDNLIFKHDTVEMNFNFRDGQQSILPSMTRDNKELSTGVGFDTTRKRKIYMLSPNGFSTTASGGNNRYENPIQPEVLTYIKSNWNKLDSCFKELADRKGIMK